MSSKCCCQSAHTQARDAGLNSSAVELIERRIHDLLAGVFHHPDTLKAMSTNPTTAAITASGASCFSFWRCDFGVSDGLKPTLYEINTYPDTNEKRVRTSVTWVDCVANHGRSLLLLVLCRRVVLLPTVLHAMMSPCRLHLPCLDRMRPWDRRAVHTFTPPPRVRRRDGLYAARPKLAMSYRPGQCQRRPPRDIRHARGWEGNEAAAGAAGAVGTKSHGRLGPAGPCRCIGLTLKET